MGAWTKKYDPVRIGSDFVKKQTGIKELESPGTWMHRKTADKIHREGDPYFDGPKEGPRQVDYSAAIANAKAKTDRARGRSIMRAF